MFISVFVSVYLSFRNWIYLSLVGKDFTRKFHDIEKSDVDNFKQFYHSSDNPLINIISEVVLVHAQHSQDIRAEVAYMFHRNFSSVTSGIAYLRFISVVSPLLGLLGTMLGMIDVFQVVASSPTLLCYYIMMLKMKRFRIEAIEHSYRATELFNTACPLGRALAEAKKKQE